MPYSDFILAHIIIKVNIQSSMQREEQWHRDKMLLHKFRWGEFYENESYYGKSKRICKAG